jgi:hypothetical protein
VTLHRLTLKFARAIIQRIEAKAGRNYLKELIMEEDTVGTSSMDAETVEILLDDRVATGG